MIIAGTSEYAFRIESVWRDESGEHCEPVATVKASTPLNAALTIEQENAARDAIRAAHGEEAANGCTFRATLVL